MTTALWVLSSILLAQGAVASAEEAAREGLHLAAQVQDPWATGAALLQHGMVALAQEDTTTARDCVQESVTIFSELGESWSRGRALVTMGWVAHAQGKEDEAQTWFQQALNLGRATQLDPVALNAQYGLAYLMQEDAPAAALAFLDRIIAHPATEQTTRDRATDLRRTLIAADSDTVTAAQHEAAGVRMLQTGETLTPREVEVLRLLAQGRSNQVIAEELGVAVGTINRHVNSILGKLQAQSRLEAVARALGLV